MEDLQNSGLNLKKVAQDFDSLDQPEPSTYIILKVIRMYIYIYTHANIILKFTYNTVSSPFPNTIFLSLVSLFVQNIWLFLI